MCYFSIYDRSGSPARIVATAALSVCDESSMLVGCDAMGVVVCHFSASVGCVLENVDGVVIEVVKVGEVGGFDRTGDAASSFSVE